MESQKELNMEKYLKETDLNLKARFFAQYFGQHVLYFTSDFLRKIDSLTLVGIENDDYLELKPLSHITDEDAIELMRLKIESKGVVDIETIEIENKTLDGYTFIVKYKNWDDERVGFVFNGHTNPLSFYDYLRSKGYALPYMDLSVEDLVEYGWIKLKEN